MYNVAKTYLDYQSETGRVKSHEGQVIGNNRKTTKTAHGFQLSDARYRSHTYNKDFYKCVQADSGAQHSHTLTDVLNHLILQMSETECDRMMIPPRSK